MTTPTPPYTAPRGMQWRIDAQGDWRLRVRVHKHGTLAASGTFAPEEIHLATEFQRAAREGRDPEPYRSKGLREDSDGHPDPDASSNATPPPSPAPQAPATPTQVAPLAPEGLSAESTIEEAWALCLKAALSHEIGTAEHNARYAPSSLFIYDACVRPAIAALGPIRVRQLLPGHLEGQIRRAAYEQGTDAANKTRSALLLLIRSLGKWELIEGAERFMQAKVPQVPTPDERQRPALALSLAQLVGLIAPARARDTRLGASLALPMLVLGGLEGLTPGEARALTVKNIDLGARTVKITGAMKRVTRGGRSAPGTAKDTFRARTLEICDLTVAVLGEVLDGMGPTVPGEPVIWAAGRRGSPACEAAVRKAIGALGESIGVHLVPKDLRTTAATNARRDGIRIEAVARMLGHSESTLGRTLTKHYSKATDEDMLGARDVRSAAARAALEDDPSGSARP